jgi:hypothetical protein
MVRRVSHTFKYKINQPRLMKDHSSTVTWVVSNPGLLYDIYMICVYDRDYASAPCALLPLPSPTARTSKVILSDYSVGHFSGCAGLVNNFGFLIGLVF